MTTCNVCGAELHIGDFPFCKGDPSKHQRFTGIAISDDIPGGVLINHAICNDDGTPKRYYSKSEIAKAAKAAGYTNFVRHVGNNESDKSPFTTRWI
jgi:hypothetical protein